MERSDLVREALGEQVFDWFIRNKRIEWHDYRTRVTPWERENYLAPLGSSRIVAPKVRPLTPAIIPDWSTASHPASRRPDGGASHRPSGGLTIEVELIAQPL